MAIMLIVMVWKEQGHMSTLIAAAQLQSSAHPDENLAKAEAVLERAAVRGAKLVIFPEIFMAWLAPHNFKATSARRVAQSLEGPFVRGLMQAARHTGVWVVSGMLETDESSDDKTYNTTVVIDDQGQLVAAYRKTHLYDAFGYRESDVYAQGDRLFTPIDTPFGRMGLFVCYELRFPEVARFQAERGVDFFVMPAAWVNGALKEAHWRNLVTARAIENTTYLFACGQSGNQYLGRSLLVDPMGVVLAEGSEEESLLYAEIDLQRIVRVREQLPSLRHRRTALYSSAK
jgi:predicted amidohydrolase